MTRWKCEVVTTRVFHIDAVDMERAASEARYLNANGFPTDEWDSVYVEALPIAGEGTETQL